MSRPVIFGEVLFDRFPDGSEVLGGAPFNVAWNLRGLGLDPCLVSRVGRDALGARILEAMEEFGLDRSAVQLDDHHATGTVEVELVDGEPRFDIVEDRAWDHIASTAPPGEPAVLYHGSLALRTAGSRASAEELLSSRRAPVFFDVNLRDPWWKPEPVRAWMAGAHTIKVNEDEVAKLASRPGSAGEQARELLGDAGAGTIVVTRGAEGALAIPANADPVATRPVDPVPVVDTVGAGDAFSSVLILGILEDWPLELALDRARNFAEAVVGLRGATSMDPGFYSRFRTAWSAA